MPRGRPRKNPVVEVGAKSNTTKVIGKKSDDVVSVNQPEITDTGTKRGRKAAPKEYPVCEFCGKEIKNGNPWQIRFNQLVGTGEYRFRAINTKPNLCKECYLRTVRALDNWLLKNGIPEKFTEGRGFRIEDITDNTANTAKEDEQ